MIVRVLLAIADPARLERFRGILVDPDMMVHVADAAAQNFWPQIAREACDLFVVDAGLIPDPPRERMRLLLELPDPPLVVVVTDEGEPRKQAVYLAAGCDAVLFTGLSDHMLRALLTSVLDRRRGPAEQDMLVRRKVAEPRLNDFVSLSLAMQAFMAVVRRVVPANTSLLILGETGVGKERLARAIHAEGPRASGPFVAVNCGALPEALLESELFGHEEGAFTGATRSRRGWFELAHNGTVFLDEVGEMPPHLQVKLLRALQDHEVVPVGGEQPLKVDVRVMAASNRDLAQDVENRLFRRDLFYRLSVFSLTIPPLRDRREDIPALVDSYIGHFQSLIDSPVDGIADDALESLCTYGWPGNVRELINVIERAMLLAESDLITPKDLPQAIAGRALVDGQSGALGVTPDLLARPIGEARRIVVDRFERIYLTELLTETGGRVGETAARAGIDTRSLYDKMKRYDLRKEDFRP